MAIRKEAWRL